MMGRKKTVYLYVAYTFLSVLFFAYILFPSDVVQAYLSARMQERFPALDITIGSVKPGFPLGIQCNRVNVAYNEMPVLDAEQLTLSPGLFSLFRESLRIYFDCDAYHGNMSGHLDLLRDKGRITADAGVADVRLEDLTILQDFVPHALKGRLSGKIGCDVGMSGAGRSVRASLKLVEAGVEFAGPFYGLEKLAFDEIDADLSLEETRLKVDRLTVKGPDANGSVGGTIILRNPVDRSMLNLSGEVIPQPLLIDKLRKKFPVDAFLKQPGNNKIPFRIGGTPDSPRFSMR